MNIPNARQYGLLMLSLCLNQTIQAALANPTDTNESRRLITVNDATVAAALKHCSPSPAEITANIESKESVHPAYRCLTYTDYQITGCNSVAMACRHAPEAPQCQEFLYKFSSTNTNNSNIEN